MKVTILGSGTSHGVPAIGCSCDVCRSTDSRDKRTRASVLIEHHRRLILVDAGPDFRIQALRLDLKHLDGILMTHAHADHLHGLDDVRSLTYANPLDVYGSKETIDEIHLKFDYAFKNTQIGGGKPNLLLVDHRGEKIQIGDIRIQPIPVKHGTLNIYGYRIGPFAYITDASEIPDASIELLSGVQTLVINALRYRPHPTHFNIDQALSASRRIGAEKVWFTHLCHDVRHKVLMEDLDGSAGDKQSIFPAYDGLVIDVEP